MPDKKINIDLEAGTAAFISGMDRSAKAVEGLGHKAHESKGFLDTFKEGLELGGGLEVAKIGFESVEKALDKVVEIGTEAVKTMAEWTAQAMESAEQAVNLATSLGYDVETIQALSKEGRHLGVSAEDVQSALRKLSKEMGEVAAVGGPVADKLGKLGINVEQLKTQTPDQQLRTLADAISQLDSRSERATLAVDLFGKSGAKLLPLFSDGAKGIDEAIRRGEKFGDVLSGLDTSKLVAAKEATDEVGRAFDGLKNELALALAPQIEHVSNLLLGLGPDAKRSGSLIDEAITESTLFAAAYADEVAHLAGEWARVVSYVELAAAIAAKGPSAGAENQLSMALERQAAQHAAQADALAGTDFAGKVHDEILAAQNEAAKSAAKLADEMKEAGKNAGQALGDGIADGWNDKKSKVDGLLDSLHKQVEEFGLTAGQKRMHELLEGGASWEQLKQANEDAKSLDALEAQKRRVEEAKRIWEQAETPVQKFTERIKELQDLFEHGAFSPDLSQNQQIYEAALARAKEDYDKAKELLARKDLVPWDDAKTPHQHDREAALVSRQFDFRVPGQSTSADPQRELVNGQKRQIDYFQSWDKTFTALWNSLNGTGAQTANVLDTGS